MKRIQIGLLAALCLSLNLAHAECPFNAKGAANQTSPQTVINIADSLNSKAPARQSFGAPGANR